MSAVAPQAERTLRIGELAELTQTTPRTIRYWEEIGLIGGTEGREQGKHRLYTETDVERVREVVRMRDLLNLSLEQLSRLLEAESARRHLREEYHQTEAPAARRRILTELGVHIDTQLELVNGRLAELIELRDELTARRSRVDELLNGLGAS